MTRPKMELNNFAHLPVRQLKAFAKAISEHDLWDELEQHLAEQGYASMKISFEPVHAIGAFLRARQSAPARANKVHPVPDCSCNGTFHPPPNTPPPHGGGDGGPGDGGPGDGGPRPQ